jgi:hypothetical protein
MTMATKKEVLLEHLAEWLACRGKRKARAEMVERISEVLKIHQKSVSRSFYRVQMSLCGGTKRRGRPVVFGCDATAALFEVWEAANHPCGEILFPIIAEYVAIFRRDGTWKHGQTATAALLAMKEHTVRRRVGALRTKHRFGKGLSSTKPSVLKNIIPIFKGPWKDLPPGNGQIDTVAHCGSTLAGDFIFSLGYTDSATYWGVHRAQWNKGQTATVKSMIAVKEQLPFPWLMAHPDTGSEFINWTAKAWCDEQGIELTRSEPNKKNDNMYVEERNGHVVRRYLGYLRLDDEGLVCLVNELYDVLDMYLNHFIPVRRTTKTERVGAKYKRTYEKRAMTPYQRVLDHKDVAPEAKERLKTEHALLNPLTMKKQIDTITLRILKTRECNHEAE